MFIHDLIQQERHQDILMLESPKYDKYKAIAHIYLVEFEKAVTYMHNNTFEKAYCYYKLKKFKRAFRILKKLQGKKVDILTAQCLYFYGKYNDAYTLLGKYDTVDEYGVNLSAIEALNMLSSTGYSGLFSYKPDNKIVNIFSYTFFNNECKMEYEFNSAFKFINNEEQYLNILYNLNDQYSIFKNSYFNKQILNLTNQSCLELTKKQSDIFNYNTIPDYQLSTLDHFQNNFCGTKITEYKLMKTNLPISKKYIFTKNLLLKYLVNIYQKYLLKKQYITKQIIQWCITKLKFIEQSNNFNFDIEISALELLLLDENDSQFQQLSNNIMNKLK